MGPHVPLPDARTDHTVPALLARPLLGLLDLAAADLAGATVDALPVEMAAGA